LVQAARRDVFVCGVGCGAERGAGSGWAERFAGQLPRRCGRGGRIITRRVCRADRQSAIDDHYFGNQYEGGDELYDAKITVLEVVRGKKARDAIREASASNTPPRTGWEYLVARVRFEYTARTKPGQQTYAVNPGQFIATSASGTDYPPVNLAAEPKPELNATLHSGDSAEGWVAMEIPQGERRPLMVFQADTGSVFHEGGGSVFQLYEGAQGTRGNDSP
jgi:hypothetical protein